MIGQISFLEDSYSQKIHKAIEILKMYEPIALRMSEEGYYLAFSGGKDSIACMILCDLACVKYQAHYNITGIDPPELVYCLRKNYPQVIQHKYEKSMIELIAKKGAPTRRKRFCCEVLKEHGGEGCFVITGVRKEESEARSRRDVVEILGKSAKDKVILNNDNDDRRRQLESCQIKGKRVLNIILDWKEEEVWQLIHEHKYPYPSLYDEGFSRIGCICCPLPNLKNRERELKRFPKFKEYYIHAFDLWLDNKKKKAKEKGEEWTGTFKTGNDVFNWWMGYTKNVKQVNGQLEFNLEDLQSSKEDQRLEGQK